MAFDIQKVTFGRAQFNNFASAGPAQHLYTSNELMQEMAANYFPPYLGLSPKDGPNAVKVNDTLCVASISENIVVTFLILSVSPLILGQAYSIDYYTKNFTSSSASPGSLSFVFIRNNNLVYFSILKNITLSTGGSGGIFTVDFEVPFIYQPGPYNPVSSGVDKDNVVYPMPSNNIAASNSPLMLELLIGTTITIRQMHLQNFLGGGSLILDNISHSYVGKTLSAGL